MQSPELCGDADSFTVRHDDAGEPEDFTYADSKERVNATRASVAARKRLRESKGIGPYSNGTSPTTSEHDYVEEELLFMRGIQAFQNRTGRKFPTSAEYLWILKDLGFRREIRCEPTEAAKPAGNRRKAGSA